LNFFFLEKSMKPLRFGHKSSLLFQEFIYHTRHHLSRMIMDKVPVN
jgi:hypothetical protein